MSNMATPPLVEINAFTHQGRVRESNEDSVTVAGWVSDVVLSGPRRSRHELTEPLLVALAEINAEIYQSMMAAPSLRGMGTTVAGLLLVAGRAIWFNIGDSRIYRYRGGKLEQLSIDDVPG